jgi:hypothetical protein
MAFGLLGAVAACERPNPLFGYEPTERDGSGGSTADAGTSESGAEGGTVDVAGTGGGEGQTDTGGSAGNGGNGGNAGTGGSPGSLGADAADAPAASDGRQPETPPATSGRLVAYWSFDNTGSGVVAQDDSGNAHHGMLEGLAPAVAWVVGRRGGALSVDGQADNRPGVVVAPSPALDAIRVFTIAAWIMRAGDASDTTTRAILSRRQSGTEQSIKLAVRGAELVGFVPTTAEAPGAISRTNAVPLLAWTHVAATYDGNVLAIYANGSLLSAGQFPYVLQPTLAPMYIGTAKTAGNDQPFQGLIDDAVVFGFVMTAAQVKALAEGAPPSSF